MKFGKVLQQSQQVSSAAWEPNWVDYKLLKKIIKDCAQIQKEEKLQGATLVKTKIKPSAKEDNESIRTSPDEENFFRTLRSEIKKIGDFFVKEQAAYIGRVKEVEEVFLQLQTDPKPETKTELMQRCVALYKELLLLENFAVMNFCGISKILKKHDKWTGYATRNKFMRTILMKQPFATYLPLLQMIDRLEHIFMEATGNSIDQHHSRRRGGGGGSAGMGSTNASGSPSNPSSGSGGSTNPNSSPAKNSHNGLPPVNKASNSPTRPSPDPGYDSPAPDGSVTLGRVHALRDDARQFRETEGVDYDGDDSGDSADDSTMRGLGSPQSDVGDQASSTVDMTMRRSMEPVTTTAKTTGLRKDYSSDSDAVAIAMLSMKEAGRTTIGAGFRSGSDSEGGSRFKRKACSPLPSDMASNGKRKMSFATILN